MAGRAERQSDQVLGKFGAAAAARGAGALGRTDLMVQTGLDARGLSAAGYAGDAAGGHAATPTMAVARTAASGSSSFPSLEDLPSISDKN